MKIVPIKQMTTNEKIQNNTEIKTKIGRKNNLKKKFFLISGAAGISKAQEIVENFLLNFFNSTYPTKKPPGMNIRLLLAI